MKIILVIVGVFQMILGGLSIYVGVTSSSRQGHDLSEAWKIGVFLLISGIGLTLLRKWGAVLTSCTFLYLSFMLVTLFNSPMPLYAFLLNFCIFFSIPVMCALKWKELKTF